LQNGHFRNPVGIFIKKIKVKKLNPHGLNLVCRAHGQQFPYNMGILETPWGFL